MRLRHQRAFVSHPTNCKASEVGLNRLFIECSPIRLLALINKGPVKFVLAKIYYTWLLSANRRQFASVFTNKSNNLFNFGCLFVYLSIIGA